MDQKEPKKVTLGLVLSWTLGVFFAIGGFGMLFTNFFSGLLVLLVAVILLPPANKFIEKKLNFTLSTGLKIVLILVLLTLGGLMLNKSEDSTDLDTAVDDLNESVDDLKEAVGNDTEEKEQEEKEEEIVYTKVELGTFFEEYETNEVNAQEKYVGNYIETTGTVTDVSKDILDKVYVSLEPSSADKWYVGPTLQCYIKEGESVSDLSKGDTITVQGRVAESTMTMISVTAKDCIVKR